MHVTGFKKIMLNAKILDILWITTVYIKQLHVGQYQWDNDIDWTQHLIISSWNFQREIWSFFSILYFFASQWCHMVT